MFFTPNHQLFGNYFLVSLEFIKTVKTWNQFKAICYHLILFDF